MLYFWIVSEDGDHGSLAAQSLNEAEISLFEGILADEYPIDAILIEQIEYEDDEPEVADEDILSSETIH